jgi:hypothetical protein
MTRIKRIYAEFYIPLGMNRSVETQNIPYPCKP